MAGSLSNTTTRAFVFGLADDAGQLKADELYRAAEACGFSTTQMRLALRRLTEEGHLHVQGRGRKAHITLTASGIVERQPDLAWSGVAYRADAGLDPWDQTWHLAAFEIPESMRPARDALRQRITELFGGQLSSGLYVSPFAWEPWLENVADHHGVGGRLTTLPTSDLRHRGETADRMIASMLWPVESLHDEYLGFLDRWQPVLDQVPDDPIASLRAAFTAADDFSGIFRRDPLLPPALAPADFAGPRSRALFIDLVDALSHHEVVRRANLFGTYRRTIADALTVDSRTFWRDVYEKTSAP